jgi:hypothetical protein
MLLDVHIADTSASQAKLISWIQIVNGDYLGPSSDAVRGYYRALL